MIRAMIGTVAVLAGFAVVESSVDASTGLAGSCRPSEAYILLQPGQQVPVRAEPTPAAAGGGALATQDMSSDRALSVVALTGSRSGWARIALNSRDYTAIAGASAQYGWIPADLLLVSSRGDGPTTMLSRPGLLGVEIGRVEANHTFRVLGCRGELLHVINSGEGNVWIDRWSAKAVAEHG